MGKKLSLDLTDQNEKILDSIKEKTQYKYGKIINDLIDLSCRIPVKVQDELFEFCRKNILEINKTLPNAGIVEHQALLDKKEAYLRIAKFFNQDIELDADFLTPPPRMQKIKLNNSTLICPFDYIILNQQAADKMNYAYVIEIQNANISIPHFVYLCQEDLRMTIMSPILREIINMLCIDAWPQLKNILDNSPEDAYRDDFGYQWKPIEPKEIDLSFAGINSVYVQGDTRYPMDYKPPLGAVIIRNLDLKH